MYSFVQSDTGSKLRVTCVQDSDDAAFNLTGYTARLRFRMNGGTVNDVAMTVISAASGILEYQFAANELGAGELTFAVRLTDTNSKRTSSLEAPTVFVRTDM